VVYDPHELFVFWIDEELKKATQAARRSGKAFPESTKVVDAYRLTTESLPASRAPTRTDNPGNP
jgi:hypothetical protein